MADEVEVLRKELALARVEIDELRLRLSNALLMLKKEMLASATLATPAAKPAKDEKVPVRPATRAG